MDVYNMDDIKLEIYSEGDHCNFSPWMEEKITNILHDLLMIVPENEEMETYIASAFGDALKIYALCIGINIIYNDTDIRYFIFENKLDGLEYVKYVLGRSTKKGVIALTIKDNQLIDDICSLITTEKTNRTLIHEKLAKLTNHNDWTEMITYDLEEVTMCNKTWEWFYSQHKNDVAKDYYFFVPEIPKSLR